MKKSRIALSLALALGTTVATADTMTSGVFDMYNIAGGLMNSDATITGSIDTGAGTWAVASAATFFGALWSAHNGTTFGPGTYNIDTLGGGSYTNIVVGAGQVGGHILFDWNGTTDIDVVNVWDVAGDTYTSTDVVADQAGTDGILGLKMIDGAFVGSSANFDFVAPAAVPVPAAVWLFGSGLLGLVGVARRKKTA